jgi:glycosyltransferase involved in cell wall biosynthesis
MVENNYQLYINKASESWITDRFRTEWHRQNANSTYFIRNADIVWLISPWTWKKLNKNKLKKTKTICTIHHIDESKFEIPFWVDPNKFYEIKNKKLLRSKYGIEEKDFVIGSFQRDTEGHDLKSPKLSKGPDLFIKNLEKIKLKNPKKNVKVLIAGYRRNYVLSELKKLDIDFINFEKPKTKILNELYNCLDLYIVASRTEGGPMAILECGLARVPIISTDVGIASEILNTKSIYNMENFITAEPDIEYAYNQASKHSIKIGMEKFSEMFRNLYES